MMQGGLSLIAFPEKGFRVLSEVIPDASQPGVEARHRNRPPSQVFRSSDGHNRRIMGHVFALMLTDGLANARGGAHRRRPLGPRRHPAHRRIGRRRPRLSTHRARPQRPRGQRQRAAVPDRERLPVPRLQNAKLRADADQTRRHRREHRKPHRLRTQRRARRARVRRGHRPAAGRTRPLQLRVLSARRQNRRRLLLPLDPQHEPRRQPCRSSAPSTKASCSRWPGPRDMVQLHRSKPWTRSTARSAAPISSSASTASCAGSTPRAARCATASMKSIGASASRVSTPTASNSMPCTSIRP